MIKQDLDDQNIHNLIRLASILLCDQLQFDKNIISEKYITINTCNLFLVN